MEAASVSVPVGNVADKDQSLRPVAEDALEISILSANKMYFQGKKGTGEGRHHDGDGLLLYRMVLTYFHGKSIETEA